MMKIAVSSYSFSQAQRDERHMNLFDMIKKAKELGFEGFEVVDFNFKSTCPEGTSLIEYAKQVKEACAKEGLTITSYTKFISNSKHIITLDMFLLLYNSR